MSIQATYELRLKDHSGSVVARFPGIGRDLVDGGGLRFFSYQKRLFTPGASNVSIYGSDNRIPLYLSLPQSLDYQWEFWRNDPLDNTRGFYKDFETFHRAENPNLSDGGVSIYLSRGQGYNVFTVVDVVDYDAGTAQSKKSGDATAVALELVTENIGISAGVDLDGQSRVRPGLSTAVAPAAGINYSDEFSGVILSDALRKIAAAARFEYMVEGAGPGLFTFNWRPRPYGFDRRSTVVFESQRANATDLQTNYSFLNSITSVSMRGAGNGSLQVRSNVNDTLSLSYSPWSRRCVTRTATQEVSTTSLDSIGLGVIRENESKQITSFNYRQTSSTRYGRDWDVGDWVTLVDFYGSEKDMSVHGVSVAITSDGVETIIPELEEVIP